MTPTGRRAMRAFAVSVGFAAAYVLLVGPAARASSTWSFDLPATGLPSLGGSYATVATITLTQTPDGVQFTLDPNESSPGFRTNAFIHQLDLVYSGAPLSGSSFRNDGGVPASFGFQSNPHKMDAGYTADGFHIDVDFPSRHRDRLGPTGSSAWTVLGTTLSDFTGSFATAHNKPSAIYGVLSVSGYSLPGAHPCPSNWVAAVPEPGTAGLALLGLGLLGAGARQRSH
jgi:MYXO-CTERM domain-containing protein